MNINNAISSEPEIIIDPDKGYSLNSIKISFDGAEFYPSYFGGISVINNGEVFHPWSPDVKYTLIKKNVDRNQIYTEWIMYKYKVFYYHYEMTYVQEKSNLTIHVKDLGELSVDTLPKNYAEVFAVLLDRCENAVKPVMIGVPYLTTFNLLFSNNCFTSMYFDWSNTNASQIIPYNKIYTNSSVYYSQYAQYNPLTNGIRNKLNEVIFLKTSSDFDNVMPDLFNPISKFKEESSKRIVFDDWDSFDKSIEKINNLKENGLDNIWHIVHNWQKSGYDVALPDVFPANSLFGGNNGLRAVSDLDTKLGFLFGLHENYIDIFKASSKYNNENMALNTNGRYIFNWYNGDTSFLVKPTKIFSNLVPITKQIKEIFNTTSVYHDVSASYDSSKYVDYDYKVDGAGKFSTPYNIFKSLADTLRKIHKGPVSSEGLAHFLYVGYYDDICAQIHTAQSLPGSYGTETQGGYYKPLLINFDLLKMKEKAMVHGVGYYERFFYKDNYWQYMGRSKDSALIYAATELAYGHGAFFSSLSNNFIEQGLIEYNFVYPIQLLYADSKVSKILYNDKGNLITASEYIKKYPYTFDKLDSIEFMSQVFIEYDNGLKIYVNRNPAKEWIVDYSNNYGFYSSHYTYNGNEEFLKGYSSGKVFVLPRNNGWLCYFQK